MHYFTKLYAILLEVFNPSHFCEIAAIGPFNRFSFEEIQSKLNYTKVTIVKRESDRFLVQLDNKQTKLLVWYCSDGSFKSFESEHWKDMNVVFGIR